MTMVGGICRCVFLTITLQNFHLLQGYSKLTMIKKKKVTAHAWFLIGFDLWIVCNNRFDMSLMRKESV